MAMTGTAGVIRAGFEEVIPRRRHWARNVGLAIRRNPLGFFGLVVIVALTLVAIFAPAIAPYRVGDVTAGPQNEAPSWDHFFGTDVSGRDMFSRVVFGARISLAVGFLSVMAATALATVLGIFSGYAGGIIDNVMQRIVDTALAFPLILLLLILAQVLGPSFWTVVFAIAAAIVFPVTRVVRGAVLSERNNQYVEAARALGASTPRILFIHIAPNVTALAIILATTLLGSAILGEATLSFLGLGIPVPNPSWGTDVSLARNSFPIHLWWAFFPGAAITLTVLGFNLLGDAMRDIFDPRLRGRL